MHAAGVECLRLFHLSVRFPEFGPPGTEGLPVAQHLMMLRHEPGQDGRLEVHFFGFGRLLQF